MIFDNPLSENILTADITYYDVFAGIERVFRAASEFFITSGSDSPAHTQYIGCIQDDVFFERSMYAGEIIGGAALPDRGALTLINTLDPFGYEELGDWLDPSVVAVEGRGIDIYLHGKNDGFASRIKVFSGKIAAMTADENALTIVFMSNALALEKSIVRSHYAGTGGDEGITSMAGVEKPLVFGKCYSVPVKNLDSATYRTQVHDGVGDGALHSVLEVRDKSYPLTVTTDYTVVSVSGIIDLVAAPAGDVVADVEGSLLGGTFSAKAADICAYIADHYAGLSVDTVAISAANAAADQSVGFFISADATMFDVIDQIAQGFGNPSLSHGLNRNGEFTMQMFAAPSGGAVLDFDDLDIEDGSLTRIQVGKVAYKVTLRGRKNWATIDKSSAATALSMTTKELYAADYQLSASAEDASIKTIYPQAVELGFDTLLTEVADLTARASDLLDWWGQPRYAYSMTVNLRPLTLELGDCIMVTHPRYNLSSGKLLRVVTIREYYLQNRVELTGVA